MPAVITHEVFGRELYGRLRGVIGESIRERDAFLIGNQGPDVLFFSAPDPSLAAARGLGSALHQADPGKVLACFRRTIDGLPENEQSIGRSYVLGLLCHYAADRTLHPFVYSQQYALEAAGVSGLNSRDGHEIHAFIESELDDLVLFRRLGRTIRDFTPARETLRGDRAVLDTISRLYATVAREMFARSIPAGTFRRSLRIYRAALRLLHSPGGNKRRWLGKMERLARRHSFAQAMSHLGHPRTDSAFANSERNLWIDPFTNEMHREDFWELHECAQQQASQWIEAFDRLSPQELAAITNGIDFNGRPTA